MHIAIVGHANPFEFKDYFNGSQMPPNINGNAASVNAHIQSLLDLGHVVYVFTYDAFHFHDLEYFDGKQLHFVIIPRMKSKIKRLMRYGLIKSLQHEISKKQHEIDIIHAQWTYEYAYAILPFAKEKPCFCTVRDWCPYQMTLQKHWRDKLYWRWNQFFFKRVMATPYLHLIANSEYTYACIKAYDVRLRPHKIFNSIKSKFILTTRKYYPQIPTYISIAQSITDSRKNIETLLQAFAKLQNQQPVKLKLTGRYEEGKVAEWRSKQWLNNVELLGAMSHDDVISVLDSCSVLVHPAIEETFGNILLEGMARRIPVIGGQEAGGVPQVLGQGKYGILCDVTSVDSLLQAMLQAKDAEIVQPLITKATDYLQRNFSSDIIGEKHLQVYQSYGLSSSVSDIS